MGDWALEQYPESLWCLTLGDIQKPTGPGTGRPAMGVPAWAGIRPDDLQGSLPASPLLWFCIKTIAVYCKLKDDNPEHFFFWGGCSPNIPKASLSQKYTEFYLLFIVAVPFMTQT